MDPIVKFLRLKLLRMTADRLRTDPHTGAFDETSARTYLNTTHATFEMLNVDGAEVAYFLNRLRGGDGHLDCGPAESIDLLPNPTPRVRAFLYERVD